MKREMSLNEMNSIFQHLLCEWEACACTCTYLDEHGQVVDMARRNQNHDRHCAVRISSLPKQVSRALRRLREIQSRGL